ncbi:MAG: acetyl-CoA carboxylase biotin carboxylase subunit [Deltaproteobacteria bacterium]|nr:MAG: acetyl-CoA carboxylase biotin carboxylase subunit [Deltaproteobacteria bacterium]
MFRRILIANRGEVAARVARTAARLGIETVAVASAADADQAWLSEVDRVVRIGPARAARSYLDVEALIEVGRHTGCAAVHPGWGFLSENEHFAARCEAAGLTFIGPRPRHIREFGDKSLARATMGKLGMPLIPGSKEPVADAEHAKRVAEEVGYPVLLKAVAGGGGRGMRGVDRPEDLAAAFEEASAEALASFGDGRMYLERRIVGGRHVEVQVLGDAWGNAVVLGERECSLQRRHQKVLEEAPAPGLSPDERARILPIVADVVRRSGYRNAGTVEMLVDATGKAYFMEMNTRLQVEHPVTEEIMGVDLVEHQLRIAANQRLSLTQDELVPKGHAIECRINAEDPDDGFRPCPGLVETLDFPEGEGIRVDTHLTAGDRIPPNYDSMVAKLIAYGADRSQAIERMKAALAGTRIDGVTTNIELHKRILDWDLFVSGRYDTTSLETHLVGRS